MYSINSLKHSYKFNIKYLPIYNKLINIIPTQKYSNHFINEDDNLYMYILHSDMDSLFKIKDEDTNIFKTNGSLSCENSLNMACSQLFNYFEGTTNRMTIDVYKITKFKDVNFKTGAFLLVAYSNNLKIEVNGDLLESINVDQLI
jgi:hypothetical protein